MRCNPVESGFRIRIRIRYEPCSAHNHDLCRKICNVVHISVVCGGKAD